MLGRQRCLANGFSTFVPSEPPSGFLLARFQECPDALHGRGGTNNVRGVTSTGCANNPERAESLLRVRKRAKCRNPPARRHGMSDPGKANWNAVPLEDILRTGELA